MPTPHAPGIYERSCDDYWLPEAGRRRLQRKLTQILRQNEIREIALLRMEVPCCGGLEYAAATALKNSEKNIQMQVTVITIDGKIKEVR